jgi:sulfoxide reductase heme-binding subunit YedZ
MNFSSEFVDPSGHLWWLASRASGIVAMLLLTYTMLVGLMMGGKLVQRLAGRPGKGALAIKRLLETHEYASLAALIAIGVHGATLLGDAYLHPSVSQLAVPFNGEYRNFYTGLGILGGYLSAALGLSFYLRSHIGVARWKKLHRFTLVAYALALAHTLGAGTDAASQWFNIPLIASAVLVGFTFVWRASGLGSTRAAGAKRRAQQGRAASRRPERERVPHMPDVGSQLR